MSGSSGPGAGRTVVVAFHDTLPGGAILSVLRTIPGLEELGWRFSFWAPRPSPLFDQLAAEGRDVRGAPRDLATSLAALRLPPGPRARIAAAPGYLRAFRAAVREASPVLVHGNSFPTFAEGLAARALRIPTVLHVHEMLPTGRKGTVAARLLALSATQQVAVSRACGARLRGPVRVVFEATPLPSTVPDRQNRDSEALTVGTVGVVSRRKGSDLFVDAAILVGERAPDVRFELIGAPTEPLDAEWAAGVLERAAGAGVIHHVSADVPEALTRWDLFALPSRRDPCPISLLEAMASGLPVIGTRVDGIPEQIAPATGLLVEPESPEALAAAILGLRDDPERRREMGAAGRRRAEESFSIERQVDGMSAAYLAALGEEPRRARRRSRGRRTRSRPAGAAPGRVLLAFHEEVMGGATLAVVRLLDELRSRGWSFVAWAPRPSELATELEALGLEVHGAPRPVSYSLASLRLPPGPRARLAGLPGYLRAFRSALAETSPVLVHANSILCLPEAVTASRGGMRVVLHVHEMLPGGPKGAAAARLARRHADAVVAVSAACAMRLARRGCRTVSVVRGGVPLDEFVPTAAGDGPPVFGCVGTISRRKGSDLFVEAARLVGERAPEVRFELVGGPTEPLEADWAADVLARAGESGVSHALRANVPETLNRWSALVAPSRADPFPNIVLEAMASGLPVIGARVDGIPEQVDAETGILVDPESPEAIAAAILELRDAPERRREMGAAGRRRAEESFSIERQAQGLEAVYEAALSEKR